MHDTSCSIVSTTVASEALAQELAGRITTARLAACVQSWPIRSVYWWQGKVESGAEILIQSKTRTELVPALQDLIRTHHPYEVPEIIVTPILGGHPAYLDWIRQETTPLPDSHSHQA